jgi:DNA-binding transcriptional LysR family regulator
MAACSPRLGSRREISPEWESRRLPITQQPTMIDLNSLAIFAKVVETRSFSEAAKRLNIPISTVSRRVAELEDQLGVGLLERSTRNLRLTDIGAEVFEHAQRSAEISEAVGSIVSNQSSTVSGVLRLSAPPSISDTLLVPLVTALQASYSDVRVQILVTDRFVDHIAEGVDLVCRLPLKDSSLVARKLLTYRHQLVASPAYIERVKSPKRPQDLLEHRLLGFSFWRPENNWMFIDKNGVTGGVSFLPFLSMNNYAGLASAPLARLGIGDLPPVVQPDLVRDGRLIEIMPEWHFRTFDLSMVHPGNRHISRPVRVFKVFAAQVARTLFPSLPT